MNDNRVVLKHAKNKNHKDSTNSKCDVYIKLDDVKQAYYALIKNQDQLKHTLDNKNTYSEEKKQRERSYYFLLFQKRCFYISSKKVQD